MDRRRSLPHSFQDTDVCRSLVENGSDAIVSINTDSTVLYANQAVERVFGYEPEARR
jgi:PAS domain S-box-containing protein